MGERASGPAGRKGDHLGTQVTEDRRQGKGIPFRPVDLVVPKMQKKVHTSVNRVPDWEGVLKHRGENEDGMGNWVHASNIPILPTSHCDRAQSVQMASTWNREQG